jgi:hypothetical protein
MLNDEVKNHLNNNNNPKICKSALAISKNKKLSKKDKTPYLKNLKTTLEETGQTSVGINCTNVC